MTQISATSAPNPAWQAASASAAAPVPVSNSVQPAAVQTDYAVSGAAVSLGLGATASGVYQSPSALPSLSSANWEHDANDAISTQMAGNYVSTTLAGRFEALGAAVLERFRDDGANYSQSILQARPGSVSGAALHQRQHTQADNQITLAITTAGGARVEVSLGSDANGLAVSLNVTEGEVSDEERAAIANLAGAFQDAVDGLASEPPRLALGKLGSFDTTLLSAVDLKATVSLGNQHSQIVSFHADAKSRSVSSTGPAGTVSVDLDLSKPTTLGSATQRAAAVDSYLRQFDAARTRGEGDAFTMSLFKDAFSSLHADYGDVAVQRPGQAGASALNRADRSMLSGLADFNASVRQNSVSLNPRKPEELDTFTYTVSQRTNLYGSDALNRGITQQIDSRLSASYHRSLSPEISLMLTSDRESQNYYYYQVDDTSSSRTDIAYENGALTQAQLTQSSNQSTHMQKFVMGAMVQEYTLPTSTSRTHDLTALVREATREDDGAGMNPRDQVEAIRTRRYEQLAASVARLRG